MTKRLEFARTTKVKRFDFAKGCCEYCGLKLQVGGVEFHHQKEAEDGGDNSFENCRALCKPCHAVVTKAFVQRIRKADRQKAVHVGAKRPAGTIRSPGFARKERREKLPLPPARSIYADKEA